MVKNDPSTDKGEQTRQHIFTTALDLFRTHGFDQTTMQEIADAAQVAKSAAYYYFPGKDALINAYYDTVQQQHEDLCADVFRSSRSLRTRVAAALHSKFDITRHDRNLLGVVFRYTGEPTHPLSCLGPATAAIRRRSIDVFRQATARERLPPDLHILLPTALWALHMGLLILFLYDTSPNQQRTRRVADGALDLSLKFLTLARLPLLKPVRSRLFALLEQANLLPDPAAQEPQ